MKRLIQKGKQRAAFAFGNSRSARITLHDVRLLRTNWA